MTKQHVPSIFSVIALFLLHAIVYGFFGSLLGGLFGPAGFIIGCMIGSFVGCHKAQKILDETTK